MDDNQKDLFESKPLSTLETELIVESMEALTNLGLKEPTPHMQKAYLEYFNQLKNLIIEYKPDGNK